MDGADKGCCIELDSSTMGLVEDLAQQWGISREETIRRAVEGLIAATHARTNEGWWEAFKELQRSLNLTPAKAAEWQDDLRKVRG